MHGRRPDPPFGYAIEPSEVSPRQKPVATLTNTGTGTIDFGLDYGLDRLIDGEWKQVKQNPLCGVPGIAIVMRPGGESWQEEIWACGRRGKAKALVPGLYRATKEIGLLGRDHVFDRDVIVRATFRVVPDADA